jgi:hypothetical protein
MYHGTGVSNHHLLIPLGFFTQFGARFLKQSPFLTIPSTSIAGMWSNNDALAAALVKASDATGEKLWRMPLEEAYKSSLNSNAADINNLGGKYAGTLHPFGRTGCFKN